MRLADMQSWISTWMLPEMHAGIPGVGAVDAWYDVLIDLESHKLEGKEFSGSVADIAKFFDQILRLAMYRIVEVVGVSKRVLQRLECQQKLLNRNCLEGFWQTSTLP